MYLNCFAQTADVWLNGLSDLPPDKLGEVWTSPRLIVPPLSGRGPLHPQ
jgi:hypothetical protein